MRNLRWILPLILLLVLMASCSDDGPQGIGVVEAGSSTEAAVPIPDDTLPFQLSEGVAGYDPAAKQLPYRGDAHWVTATGGILFATGALLWVYNMWRTFDAADARHRAQGDAKKLPTLGE